MSRASVRAVPPQDDDDEQAPAQRVQAYSLKRSVLMHRRGTTEALDTSPEADTPRPRDLVIANAVRRFDSEQHAIEVITTLWREAQAKFLAIGRNLREAKRAYPKAFERTILPQLPFGRQVAYQLRTVAEAVDGKRFGENEMPTSYGAAYQLAILDDGDLREARQEGLVNPETQRRSIEDWKRQREVARRLRDEGKAAVLREERQRLIGEAERLRSRLADINARVDEIDRDLAEREGGVTVDGSPPAVRPRM